ncbi:caspase-13 isoform X1 [Manis javanica]|uniref:caspase-13 isoform X1 n=1 Tax=Manis javanica TaxID=9974 RepID=UPI003C6D6131
MLQTDKILKEKRRPFVRSAGMGVINALLDELLEKKVLNQGEMERVKCANATVMDQARALIDSVILKGPRACQICIDHICEEDSHLAGMLGLASGPQPDDFLNQGFQVAVPPFLAPQALQDNMGKSSYSRPGGSLKLCPPETAQRIWKEKSTEIYPIMAKSTRMRLALIICNTEFDHLPWREGAQIDIRDMKMLLEGLGYCVEVKENLTASDMITELKGFAARPEHRKSDSTFVVFMSHGIQEGICGKKFSEGNPDVLKVNTVFQILNTSNCPSLKDKPKVIIIQACRGENQGVVWLKDSVQAPGNTSSLSEDDFENDAIRRAHIEKDFIAFCSSTPGDNRNRNPLKNLESLGKELCTGILYSLLEKNVLNLTEKEKDKFYDAELKDKVRVFADTMQQKGHQVEKVIVQTFLNKDNSVSVKAPANVATGPDELKESTDILKLCPPEEFLKLYKERAEEIYPIKEKQDRTRLALIICNTQFDHLSLRNGADLDVTGMKGLLEGLGYSVHVAENLTAKDMEAVLQAFATRPEHRSSDSTFLVLMSHGILDGICGTTHRDDKPDVLPYDTIFRIFNNRNCLSLKDKPKVIIVQACRGANRGELWVSDSPVTSADSSSQPSEHLEEDAVYKTHVEKDFIAFCSSTPHNVSWRDITKGSLFIAQLITCFQKYSWRYHLEEVFRKVQQSFEKPHVKAQMPTIERLSMTRYFYLFPGN